MLMITNKYVKLLENKFIKELQTLSKYDTIYDVLIIFIFLFPYKI